MKKMILISLTVLWSAQGQSKLIIPSGESVTAAAKCGARLDVVQASEGLTHQYIFDGSERLTNMQYCVNGQIRISTSNYNVPPGTVGSVSEDGTRVVLHGCVNQATCVGCKPRRKQTAIKFELEEGPALSPRPRPVFERSEPPPETVVEPPPAEQCPSCPSIVSSYGFDQISVDSAPIKVRPRIINGEVVDGTWTFNGQVISNEVEFSFNPKLLYKVVKGKSGSYFLHFVGHDAHGHVISCGTKGVLITLKQKGRHWFWTLPLVHCVYAYTKDIKNWHLDGVLEKGLCVAEVYGAYRGYKAIRKPAPKTAPYKPPFNPCSHFPGGRCPTP